MWQNGFKLHVDFNDIGLPLSVALTFAPVHVRQVAIPLIKMTSSKLNYCYDLMDSAKVHYALDVWRCYTICR